MGCVEILKRGHRPGTRAKAYANLLARGIRIDPQILEQSLANLEVPPL